MFQVGILYPERPVHLDILQNRGITGRSTSSASAILYPDSTPRALFLVQFSQLKQVLNLESQGNLCLASAGSEMNKHSGPRQVGKQTAGLLQDSHL